MPETPQEWFARVSGAVRSEGYRGGQLQQWSTWPWTGELAPKEHLHWWLYARPTGMLQLRGTFLALLDDLLPARPPEDVRPDALLWATALGELVGGSIAVP